MGGAIVCQLRFLAIEQSAYILSGPLQGNLDTKECDRAVKHHETAEIRYSFITFYHFEEAGVRYLRNLGVLSGNKFVFAAVVCESSYVVAR